MGDETTAVVKVIDVAGGVVIAQRYLITVLLLVYHEEVRGREILKCRPHGKHVVVILDAERFLITLLTVDDVCREKHLRAVAHVYADIIQTAPVSAGSVYDVPFEVFPALRQITDIIRIYAAVIADYREVRIAGELLFLCGYAHDVGYAFHTLGDDEILSAETYVAYLTGQDDMLCLVERYIYGLRCDCLLLLR